MLRIIPLEDRIVLDADSQEIIDPSCPVWYAQDGQAVTSLIVPEESIQAWSWDWVAPGKEKVSVIVTDARVEDLARAGQEGLYIFQYSEMASVEETLANFNNFLADADIEEVDHLAFAGTLSENIQDIVNLIQGLKQYTPHPVDLMQSFLTANTALYQALIESEVEIAVSNDVVGGSGSDWTLESQQVDLLDHYLDVERVSHIDRALGVENFPYMDYQLPLFTEVVQVVGNSIWNIEAEDSEAIWTLREEPLLSFDYQVYNSDEENITEYIHYDNEAFIFDPTIDPSTYQGTILRLLLTQEDLNYATSHAVMVLGSNDSVQLLGSPLSQHLNKGDAILSFKTEGEFAKKENVFFDLVVTQGDDLEDVSELFEIDTEKKEILLVSDMLDPTKGSLHFEVLVGELDIPLSSFKMDFMKYVDTEKAKSTVSGQSIVQAASASDEPIVQFSVEDNYKAFWGSAGLYEKIEDQYLLVSLEKDLVNSNGEFYLPSHLNAGVYLILAQEETTGARAFFELTITPAILPFAFNPSYSTSIVSSIEIGEEIVRLWERVPDEVSHVKLQGSNDVSLNEAQTAVILLAPLEEKSSLDFTVKLLDEKGHPLYEKSFELGISTSNTELFSPTVVGPSIQSLYSEPFQIESILPVGYSYAITEGYEIESGLIFPPEGIEEGPQVFTLAVIDPNGTAISEVEIKYDYIASFRSEGVRSQQGADDSVYLYAERAPFFTDSTVSISGLAEAARISPSLFQDLYLDELSSTSLEDTEDSALGLIASVLEMYPEKDAQALQRIYEERSKRLEDETTAESLNERYLRTVSPDEDVESFTNSFKEKYLTDLVTRFTFDENTSLEDVQNYQRFVESLDSEFNEVKTTALEKSINWFNSLSEERRVELFESRDLRTLKELAQSQWVLAYLREEGVDVESEWEANRTYLKGLDFDTLSNTQLSNVLRTLGEESPESLVSVLEKNDFNFDAPSLLERFQLALSLARIESQDSIIEDKVYTFIEKLADEIAQADFLSDEVKLTHLNKLTELYGIENYERVRLFSLFKNGSSWTASEAQAILNFAYVEDSLEAWQFVATAASNRLDLGSSSSTLLYGAVLQSHPDFMDSSAVAFQAVLEEGENTVLLIPDFKEVESSTISLTDKADDESDFFVYSTSQKLTSLLGLPLVRIEYVGDELEEGNAIILSVGPLVIGENVIVSGGDLVLRDSTALPDERFEQTLRILDQEGTVLFEKLLTFNQGEIEDNVLILKGDSRALLFGDNLVFDTSNASIDNLDRSEVLKAALMSTELPAEEVLSILSQLKDREGFEEIIESSLDTWALALGQEEASETAEELLSQLEERKSFAHYLAWDTRADSTLKEDFVGNIFSQDIDVLSSSKEKADYLTTLSEIYIALEYPEEAFDSFQARTTMVLSSLEPAIGEVSVRQALASGYPQALAQVYSHLSTIFFELDREGLDELFSPDLLEQSIPQLISAIKSEIHHPQYFDYFTDIASILSVLDLSGNKEIALELYTAAEESNFFSTVAAETWFAHLRPLLDIVRSDMELTLSRLEEVAINKLGELEPISSAAQYTELLLFANRLSSYAFHAALIERLDFSTLEFEKSPSQDIVQLSDQIAEIKVAQEVKRELQVALLTANKGLQREKVLDTGVYDLTYTASEIYIRDRQGVVAGYRVETEEAVDVLYRVLEEDALDAFSLQGSARDELLNQGEWIWKQRSDGSVSIQALNSFLTDTTSVSFSDEANYESVKTLTTYGEFKNDLRLSLEEEEYRDRVLFAGYADEDVFDIIREQLVANSPESSLEFLALLQPIAEYLDLTQQELPEDIKGTIQGIAVSDLLEEEGRPQIALKVYDGLFAMLGNNEDVFRPLLVERLASIESPETSQDYRRLADYTRILAENFLEADDGALKEQVKTNLATLLSSHIEDPEVLLSALSTYKKYSEIYDSSPEIENALIQKAWEVLPQASVQLADTAQALFLLRELDESFATAPAFDVALENYIQSLSSKSKSEKIELLQALRFIELKAEESAEIIAQLSPSTDRVPSTEDYLLLDAAYRRIEANPSEDAVLTIQYTFQDEVPTKDVIDVSIQVGDELRVIEERSDSISPKFGFATQIRQGDPLVFTYDETTLSPDNEVSFILGRPYTIAYSVDDNEYTYSFYYGETDFQTKPVLETTLVSQDRQVLMNLQYQENLQISLLSDSSAFVLSDDKMQILSAPGIKDLELGWHTLQVLVSATDDEGDTFAVEMQELRFKVLSVEEDEGATIYFGSEPRLIEAVVQTDLTSNSDPRIATLWLNFYTAAHPEWRVDEVSYKPEGEEYDKFYGPALEIREGEGGRVHLVASTLLRDLPAGEYWVKVVEASSGVSTVLEFTLEESSSPFVMQEFGPTSVKSSVDVGEVLRDFVFTEDFDFTKYQVTFEGDSRAYFDEIQRKLLVSDYIADAETIEGYLRFYDREQGQEVHRYYISIDVDKVYALSAEIVITGSTSSHVDAQRVFFLLNANPALTEYSAVLKYQDGTETPLNIEIINGSFILDGHLEVGDYTIELTLEDKAVDFAFTVQDKLLLPYGIEQAEYSVVYDPEKNSTTLVLSPTLSSFEYGIVSDSDVYAKETTLSTYVTEALVANKFEGQPLESVFLALLGALSTNEDPSETSRIVGEYLTTLIDTPMDLVSSIVSGGEEFLGKLVETLRGFGLEEFVRTSVLLEKILNEEGVTFAQGLTEDVFGVIAPTLNLFLEGVASVINLYSPLEDLIADQVDLGNIEAYTQSLRLVYPYLEGYLSEDVKAVFKGLSENVLGEIKDSQPELYLSSVLDLFIARVYDSGDLEEEFISTLTDNPTLLLKSIRAFFYETERFADLSEEWRTAFQEGLQEIETTIAQASLSELVPYLDARATIDKIPELERDATIQVDWTRYYDEIAQLESSTRLEVLTTAYESLAAEEDVFRTVLGNMLNEATKQVLTLSSWTFDELTSVLIAVSKADPATRQDLLLSILDKLPPNQEALSLFIYAWATEQKNPTYSIELESSMGGIEAASLNFYYGDALSEEKKNISFSPYEASQWLRVATVDKVSSKTQRGDRIALMDLNAQPLVGMPLSVVSVDEQEIPELLVKDGSVFWNSDESPTDSLRFKVKVGNEIQEKVREIPFDDAAEVSYQLLAYDTLTDEAGATSFWILPEIGKLYFPENELLTVSDSAFTVDSLYAKDYLEILLSDISPSSLEDLSPSEQLEALGYFLGNIRFFKPDAIVASIFQNGVDALLPLLSDPNLWQGDSLQTLDRIFTLWVDSASFIEDLSNFGDGFQLEPEKVELAYATLESALSEKVLSIAGQEQLGITQQQLADQPAGGLNPQYLQSASRFIADPNNDSLSALITFESLESQSSIQDRFDETVAFLKNSDGPVDLIALQDIQESFAKALEYKPYIPGLLDYINNLDLSALNSIDDKLEALQLTRSMLDRVDGVNSVLMDEALESLAFTARALAKEAFWADNEIVETSARVLQYSSLQRMVMNPALSYLVSQVADDVDLSEVEITCKEFERSSQVSIPLSLASDASSDDEESMRLVKKKNVALVFDDFRGTSYTEVVSNFIAESYQELTSENLRQAALYFSGSSLMELASTVESIPHFIKEYAYNALGPKTTEELTQELALYAKLKAEVPNGDWHDSDLELFAIFQSHILSLTGRIQAMNFATLSSEDWQDLEGLLNLSVTAYNAFGEDFSTQLLSSIKQLSERFPDDFIATVTHILNTLSPTQVVAKAEVYYKFLEVQLKLLIEDPGAEEVAQNIGDLIAKYPSNLEKLYENLLDGSLLKLDLMDTILSLREGVEDDLSLLWTKFLESATAYIENPELPADSLVALVDIFMQFQEANSTQEGGIQLAEFVQQAIQDRIDELSFEGLVSIFAHYPTLQSILEEGGVVYMNLSELMLTEILNQPWTLEGVSHLLDSIQDLEGEIIENLQSSIYAYLVDEVRLDNFKAISSLLKLYKVEGIDSVASIGKLLVYADEQTAKKAKLYSCSSACEPLQQAAVLKNLLTDGSYIYHTNGYFPHGMGLYSDTSDLNLKTAYEVFEDYLLNESDPENAFSALSVYWNNDWEKTLDSATEQRVVQNFLETLTVANVSMLSALLDKTEYYGDVLEALEKVEWNELNDEAMRVFTSFLEGSPGDALNSERWATLAETVYEQIIALSNSSLGGILLKQDLLQSFINTSDDAVNEVSALFDDFVAQYEAIRDEFSLENTLSAHLENATTLTQLFQIEDRFQQFFNWYTNYEELSEQVNIIDTIHAALASASFDLQTYLMNHPIDGAEQVATFFKALVASNAAGTVNEGVLQDLLDSALLIFDDSDDDATTRVNSLIDMYLSLDELPLDYSKNVLREALTKRLSEALGSLEDEIKEGIFKRVLYNSIKGGLKNVIAETAVASGDYVWAALSAPDADSFFAYEYVDALPQDLYTKAFDAISSLNREYRHNEHEDTCEEEESQATQREGRRGHPSYSLQQLSSYQAVFQHYDAEVDISILIEGQLLETSKGFTFNSSTGVLDASFAAPGPYMVMWEALDGQQGELAFHVQPSYAPDMYELVYEGYQTLSSLEADALLGQFTYSGHVENAYFEIQHLQTLDGEDMPVDSLELEENHLILKDLIPESVRVQVVLRTPETILDDIWFTLVQEVADDHVGRIHLTAPQTMIMDAHRYENFGQVRAVPSDSWGGSAQLVQDGETFYFDEDSGEVILHERPEGLASYTLERVDEYGSVVDTVTKEFYFASQEGTIDLTVASILKNTLKAGAVVVENIQFDGRSLDEFVLKLSSTSAEFLELRSDGSIALRSDLMNVEPGKYFLELELRTENGTLLDTVHKEFTLQAQSSLRGMQEVVKDWDLHKPITEVELNVGWKDEYKVEILDDSRDFFRARKGHIFVKEAFFTSEEDSRELKYRVVDKYTHTTIAESMEIIKLSDYETPVNPDIHIVLPSYTILENTPVGTSLGNIELLGEGDERFEVVLLDSDDSVFSLQDRELTISKPVDFEEKVYIPLTFKVLKDGEIVDLETQLISVGDVYDPNDYSSRLVFAYGVDSVSNVFSDEGAVFTSSAVSAQGSDILIEDEYFGTYQIQDGDPQTIEVKTLENLVFKISEDFALDTIDVYALFNEPTSSTLTQSSLARVNEDLWELDTRFLRQDGTVVIHAASVETAANEVVIPFAQFGEEVSGSFLPFFTERVTPYSAVSGGANLTIRDDFSYTYLLEEGVTAKVLLYGSNGVTEVLFTSENVISSSESATPPTTMIQTSPTLESVYTAVGKVLQSKMNPKENHTVRSVILDENSRPSSAQTSKSQLIANDAAVPAGTRSSYAEIFALGELIDLRVMKSAADQQEEVEIQLEEATTSEKEEVEVQVEVENRSQEEPSNNE